MKTLKNTELPIIHKGNHIFKTFNKIQDMIREQADHIFHSRNPDEGDALSDWLNAESKVLTDIKLTLQDNDDQVVIKGNIKGFSPEEIEIRAENGIFEIGGIHTEKASSKKKGVTKTTSRQLSFCKSLSLPDTVDTDKMNVKLKSGKFTVMIPKTIH